MLVTYFEIGKMIVEDEQQGSKRAGYAKETIAQSSVDLTKEFGKGYSPDNLERFRNFYLTYGKRISASVVRKSSTFASKGKSASVERKSEIVQSLIGRSQIPFILSWTHYVQLFKINNEDERNFYEIEARQNYWRVRELIPQYNAAMYEKVDLSKDKKAVKQLAQKGQIIEKPTDI